MEVKHNKAEYKKIMAHKKMMASLEGSSVDGLDDVHPGTDVANVSRDRSFAESFCSTPPGWDERVVMPSGEGAIGQELVDTFQGFRDLINKVEDTGGGGATLSEGVEDLVPLLVPGPALDRSRITLKRQEQLFFSEEGKDPIIETPKTFTAARGDRFVVDVTEGMYDVQRDALFVSDGVTIRVEKKDEFPIISSRGETFRANRYKENFVVRWVDHMFKIVRGESFVGKTNGPWVYLREEKDFMIKRPSKIIIELGAKELFMTRARQLFVLESMETTVIKLIGGITLEGGETFTTERGDEFIIERSEH